MSDWIPCTNWKKLEGGQQEAEKRKRLHKLGGNSKDLLLEILHNAGEWFTRYNVRRLS